MVSENQYEPVLVITNVFATSTLQKNYRGLCGAGMLLDEVNDQSVKTLAEFRDAVKKSKETRYLKILCQEKRLFILSVDGILKDEERLSQLFLYKKSSLIDYLTEGKKIVGESKILEHQDFPVKVSVPQSLIEEIQVPLEEPESDEPSRSLLDLIPSGTAGVI
jgi:hypothetical protein